MPERPGVDGGRARARLDRGQGRRGGRSGGAAAARADGLARARGSSGCTCSIRTRRTGRRRRSTRSMRPAVLRRGRGDRRGAGAAARRPARVRASDAGRRDRRSRRRARRSRRAVARAVRLRVDAARAADHRGDLGASAASKLLTRCESPGGEVSSVAGAARRHPADDPRRGRAAAAARSARPLAAAGGRAARGRAAAAVVLRGDGRDAQSRLGAADRRARRSRQVHRSADRRALRPRAPIRASASNLAGPHAERDRTLAASLRAFNAAPPGERRAEDAEAAARLRALGYVVGQRAGEGALHRGGRSEAARRSRSGDARRGRGVRRRAGSTRRCGSTSASSRGGPTWRSPTGTWRSSSGSAAIPRGAVDALQRALEAGVTERAGRRAAGRLSRRHRPRRRGDSRCSNRWRATPAADAETLNALGIAYVAGGRRDDAAQRMFERVLAIDPGSSVPLENLGVLALERGDLGGAGGNSSAPCAPIRDRRARTAGSASWRCSRAIAGGAIDAWKRAVRARSRATSTRSTTSARRSRATGDRCGAARTSSSFSAPRRRRSTRRI